MILTVYPNCEVRARVPSPTAGQRKPESRVRINLVNREKLALDPEIPLDFFKYPSCSWPRPGYGGTPKPTPFSLYGRRTMSRAGGVFCDASERRTVFLTGTLPGSTDASYGAISAHSSWVVHRLMTRIPQAIGARGADLRWMWVWEWQRRGALHWHCVLECPESSQAELLLQEFTEIWAGVIDGLSRRSGIDCAERRNGGTWAANREVWRIDAQLARKKPHKYLSKYLSKGTQSRAETDKFYPTRWYGCSRLLLTELRAATVTCSTADVPGRRDWLLNDQDVELLKWLDLVSGHTVSFCDKVGQGATVVFYPEEGNTEIVRNLVRSLKSLSFVKPMKSTTPLAFARRDRFAQSDSAVEQCVRLPHRLERLYGDLGDYYRPTLDRFLDGEDIDYYDWQAIEHTAQSLLYRLGVYRSVIPPKASEAGLTEEVPDRLETQGSLELERIYPGLPF